jgi:hypothetical protein
MKVQTIFFMRSPGGENEGNTNASNNNSDAEKLENETKLKEGEKGFFGKIKDALRDWSADDQAQQEFDDTRV